MTSRRAFAVGFVALLVGTSLLAVFLQRPEGAPGSSLSRGPRGWLVARRYVEERGAETRLLRTPDQPPGPGELLVVIFPWQRPASSRALQVASNHVRRGGTLVLAYAGQQDDVSEDRFFHALGLDMEDATRYSLNPWRWRQEAVSEWTLVPTGVAPGGGGPIRRTARLPKIPESAQILHRREDGRALSASVPVGQGRVVILPAEVLSNARLHEPGRADLLETLLRWSPEVWTFDEYHHGLSSPVDAASRPAMRAFDFWMAHGVLVYLLAVMALSRRFGPAWRDPPLTTGSARSFFLGIGTLAARLGRREEAARLLLARAQELDPRIELDPGRLPSPDSDASLLGLAQAVARAQQRRTR